MTAANPPEPIFEADRLSCARGGRLVLSHISFGLDAGTSLRVTGANGSGKSTLLRVLAGLSPPAAGRLSWRGEPVKADTAGHRARLLYVGHQDAVKAWLTPRETLLFWAGLYPGTARASVDGALARFGLTRAADLPARFLSAGQRRRLTLARLDILPAALWLLDEPTTALDDSAARALEESIAAHCESGGIVVAATHAPLALTRAATLELGNA